MKLSQFKPAPTIIKYKSYQLIDTIDGTDRFLFTLQNPITVYGSQRDKEEKRLVVKNVMQVFIAVSEFVDPANNIRIYPDTKTLKLYSPAVIDVARSGDVWITDESFKVKTSRYRMENNKSRLENLLRMRPDDAHETSIEKLGDN